MHSLKNEKTIPCKHCNGSGEIRSESTFLYRCYHCDGYGRIPRAETGKPIDWAKILKFIIGATWVAFGGDRSTARSTIESRSEPSDAAQSSAGSISRAVLNPPLGCLSCERDHRRINSLDHQLSHSWQRQGLG